MMHRLFVSLVTLALGALASAQSEVVGADAHLSQFGTGEGPRFTDGAYRLLDETGTFGQSNALALPRATAGAFENVRFRCRLRIDEGGDGGAFLFLNTAEYGERGPAPFVKSWVEPNLRRSFAVGIDVHNPKNEEMFGEWGNYQGLPEREVSLHWDGREICKRVAPVEFRGDWTDVGIRVEHVCGGAEISVTLGGGKVYDRFFLAELEPYELRLALGAGTRADIATRMDVADLALEQTAPAVARRQPLHVQLFNHVLTDNTKTSFETEVELPPASWAFGRVLLTLEIHDAGPDWDEWDRNGHFYVVDDAGEKRDIVPFITSYRTECHWQVDVTHFRPWLAGRRRFEIHAGTGFYKDRGFMMSASLDYHHGDVIVNGEPLEPFSVVPLWHVTARHQSAENHFQDAFEEREVEIPAQVRAARIVTTTTGHSQVGEFTPSERTIVVCADRDDDAEVPFSNTLWKTDCYLNSNRPQFGTWKYSRAGWAPGDVVRPWWIDASKVLMGGKAARFRYVPRPYDFSQTAEEERPTEQQVNAASHVVRSYLVLYRRPVGSVPAPIVRVTNVTGGSAAAKAGVKQGDYVAEYDGARIDSVEDLRAAKQAASEVGKETVSVVIFRGSERLEIEITTGQLGVNLAAR